VNTIKTSVAGFHTQGFDVVYDFFTSSQGGFTPQNCFPGNDDFFHLCIITAASFLYYARMKLNLRRFVALNLLCCLSLPALSATASDAGKKSGYVCVPNAAGDGWDCAEDRGQKPVVTRNKVAPAKQTKDATQNVVPATNVLPPVTVTGPAAKPLPAPNVDPNTGMSLNPEDWYSAASPRPTDAEHELVPDLAASLYVIGGDGMCPGGYQQRVYPYAVDSEARDYPMVAYADQLAAQLDVSAQLQGNVTIEQGNRRIVSSLAELDYDTRMVQFPNGVRMDEPGLVMQGESAAVHLDSKRAQVTDAQFLLQQANIRGESQAIDQNENGDLAFTSNGFTRCEPGNNGWLLRTDRLLVEDGAVFGTARNAVLRLKSVPVFYSPYLQFPVSDERVSGFLFPTMGYSDEDGVDVSIPYYFNLAPNYDATVIPRYISQRGAGGELEVRHMSAWQSTTLSGAYLPQDELYNGFIDRDDYDDNDGASIYGTFEPADRWLGAIDHEGRLGPFRTVVDYTSVSDRDYFRDLGTDLAVSSRRELERRGEVQLRQGDLFMRVWAQRFQRLDEVSVDEYQRLPEVDMTYNTSLAGPFALSMAAKWSEFDRDTDGLSGLAAVTGSRTHLEPRLSMLLGRSWGFFNVAGGYRYTAYDLTQDNNAGGILLRDDSPDRNIGFGTVDGGLFFERDLNWFGKDLIQTLEPRLYYLWQEFDEQANLPLFDVSKLTFSYSQLFRDNRFAGLDRIGDADQVSTGLTTRFISRDSGEEYFRFSLGEIFYFADRRVTLSGAPTEDEEQSSSAIAAEMSAALAGNWRVTGNIVWDPHENRVNEGGAGLQYRRDNRHIFNLGFRNRRDSDVEQTDVSLYWPITKHLALLGRWNYDLVSGRTIEGFGGLEYGDCCLQIRLMARRFLDSPTAQNFDEIEPDDGIFLQIVFKGLAGFGTKVESVLERGILGYRTPEQRDFFTN
jgi:LPS-assembly protein